MNVVHKIAIFFDGTGNTVDDPGRYTNVKKLKDLVIRRYTKGQTRTNTDPYYTEGPGTLPQTKIPGGLFGADYPDIICKAYDSLAGLLRNEIRQQTSAELYIFGFSRGSYIAHIFSWIIHDIGVTNKFSLIPDLVQGYLDKDAEKLERLKKQIPDNEVVTPVVRMLGLWDMVSSQFDLYKGYHDGERAPVVQRIYHAMSLDEKRLFFPVLKYRNDDSCVEQCWFSGVHSDIGGGYKETELSDITLEWMINNAVNEGLLLRPTEEHRLDPNLFLDMVIHDESKKQNNPRKYEGESIDDSVRIRMQQDQSYHPLALNFPQEGTTVS